MVTVPVQVLVSLEPDASEPSGYNFVHMKVGDAPSVPLPQDKPTPRRLVQYLIAAAKEAIVAQVTADRAAKAAKKV